MRAYLYAFASDDPTELPVGVFGRPVIVRNHMGVRLLLSPWESEPVPPVSAENVLDHERVVEAAMRTTAVLPFRFGTVVDEEVCRDFIERHRERIEGQLEKVAHHVEVTLKVFEPAAPTAPAAGPPATGTTYLLRKHREIQLEEERVGRARQLIEHIEAPLARWIADRDHRLAPSPGLLATATHLIPAPALADWTQAVAAVRSQFPQLDFMASGPWPPYHFAEVTARDRERHESDSDHAHHR